MAGWKDSNLPPRGRGRAREPDLTFEHAWTMSGVPINRYRIWRQVHPPSMGSSDQWWLEQGDLAIPPGPWKRTCSGLLPIVLLHRSCGKAALTSSSAARQVPAIADKPRSSTTDLNPVNLLGAKNTAPAGGKRLPREVRVLRAHHGVRTVQFRVSSRQGAVHIAL